MKVRLGEKLFIQPKRLGAKHRSCTQASLAPPPHTHRPPPPGRRPVSSGKWAAAASGGEKAESRRRVERSHSNNACSVCLSRGRPEVTPLPLIILAAAATAHTAAPSAMSLWSISGGEDHVAAKLTAFIRFLYGRSSSFFFFVFFYSPEFPLKTARPRKTSSLLFLRHVSR